MLASTPAARKLAAFFICIPGTWYVANELFSEEKPRYFFFAHGPAPAGQRGRPSETLDRSAGQLVPAVLILFLPGTKHGYQRFDVHTLQQYLKTRTRRMSDPVSSKACGAQMTKIVALERFSSRRLRRPHRSAYSLHTPCPICRETQL